MLQKFQVDVGSGSDLLGAVLGQSDVPATAAQQPLLKPTCTSSPLQTHTSPGHPQNAYAAST